ncbi:MAG: hypothetical protein LBJ48_00090, partial [Coriobacteriales bacterium]|nr:hypothetical protein [Coriobacteriales bacterium]
MTSIEKSAVITELHSLSKHTGLYGKNSLDAYPSLHQVISLLNTDLTKYRYVDELVRSIDRFSESASLVLGSTSRRCDTSANGWASIIHMMLNTSRENCALGIRQRKFDLASDISLAYSCDTTTSSAFRNQVCRDAISLFADYLIMSTKGSVGATPIARPNGIGHPKWSDKGDENFGYCQEALIKLLASFLPQTQAAGETANLIKINPDYNIVKLRTQVQIGLLAVSVVAEFSGASEFESKPLVKLGSFIEATDSTLVIRLVPSSLCLIENPDMTFLDQINEYGLLVSPRELDRLLDFKTTIMQLIPEKLLRGFSEKRLYPDYETDINYTDDEAPTQLFFSPVSEVLSLAPMIEYW